MENIRRAIGAMNRNELEELVLLLCEHESVIRGRVATCLEGLVKTHLSEKSDGPSKSDKNVLQHAGNTIGASSRPIDGTAGPAGPAGVAGVAGAPGPASHTFAQADISMNQQNDQGDELCKNCNYLYFKKRNGATACCYHPGTPRAAHSAKFWISSNADGAMINIPINNGTKWSRGFVWTCCGRDTVKQAGDPIGCVAGYHVPFDFRI